MTCPKCGAAMVETVNPAIIATYPPITQIDWRCGCGHRQLSREIRGSAAASWLQNWRSVNPGREPKIEG